ncbi:MAG: alpha/beta hydrolase family protein [Armatimonadota bacterium]
MRCLLPLPMLLLLLTAACAQPPAPTYAVKVGAFPWFDRVNQWAISVIPDKYVSDNPVSQQSCNARNLVLPTGTTKATLAVLDKQLAEFQEKQPGATDTGDNLEIKQGGAVLGYAILTMDNPPPSMDHKWMSAGLILLAVEPPLSGTATAPASAPAAAATPILTTPPAGSAAKTFSPANQASPWHDRVGRWVINNVPAAYQNLPPVPQQSCDAKDLVLPPGTKAVTIAISEGDLPEFQKRYPQIKDTGLDLTVEPPGGGTGLPYCIVAFPDPPENGDFRAFAKGGLVLLKLDASTAPTAATTAAATPAGAKQVLAQEQELVAQEWPFRPGERKVKMWVQEPAGGINANTGLMLVLHNWGGVYNSPEYLKWCKTFADRFNVVATSVNYLQSGGDWKASPPYDHGYLQAMDCLRALYTIQKQLKDKGVAFNEHRVYSMGGSGGGNVTQMVMKLAPHTFACGVDICGMPGLTDAIAYGTGEGTSLNAGYSREAVSPLFLSKDMQEIRDFGNLEHCKLLKAANPGLKIVIVHGLNDATCPPIPKVAQFLNMLQAKLEVDGHFLTEADVDGTIITSTGHAVGNREQVVIKYADVYMSEDGKLKRATTGPSDFTRGGIFEYPTTGGKFLIDFTAEPTIKFVAK